MRFLKRLFIGLTILGFLAVGTPATAADSNGKNVLRVNAAGTMDSLNPFVASNQASINVLTLTYESLARSGPDATNVPDLASEWTTEGKDWTFTLRPDMKWSDGEPLTSDDVLWTFKSMLEDDALAAQAGGFTDSVAKVSAPDSETVVVTTKSPQAVNPIAGVMIVPKHIWSKIDNPLEYENTEDLVGSGPYILNDFSRGSSAILTANPNFWRGAPAMDAVHFITYKNTDAAILALKTGELDLVGSMTTAQYKSLEGVEGITLNEADSTNYVNLSVNPGLTDQSGNPLGNGAVVLQDKLVRQAMRQAIDQQMLVDRVLEGHGSIGAEIMPPGRAAWYWDEPSLTDPYSVDDANATLDGAGYEMGADDIRLDKTGNPILLRMSYNAGSTATTQTAQFLQTWFEEIGIGITPQPTDWDQIVKDKADGTYDLFINGWGVGIDPNYMLSINACSSLPVTAGASNPSENSWCDPEFDKLYEAQQIELDEDARKVLVNDALSIHYDAAVALILYYPNPLQAYRSDRVTNLTPYAGDIDYYWAYADAEPVASTGATSASDSGWVVPVIIGGVAVIIVIGLTLVIRRRKTADERE